jgi:hypothetical protein
VDAEPLVVAERDHVLRDRRRAIAAARRAEPIGARELGGDEAVLAEALGPVRQHAARGAVLAAGHAGEQGG